MICKYCGCEKTYTCQNKEQLHKCSSKLESVKDQVTKPEHYNIGNIEAWDYIRDNLGDEYYVAYCEGNVKKYLHRWRYKGKPKEDLLKAKAYLEQMLKIVD